MANPFGRSLAGAHWVMRAADDAWVERLRAGLGLSPVIARALVCRGLSTTADVQSFLGRDLAGLHDPLLMADMDRAVTTVQQALERGARIRIYGDYDVDGVCGTALLLRALTGLGAKVDWYIPHRIDEGYGLNEEALQQAHRDGIELVITVDCGSTAVAEVAVGRSLGLELVVTDHHRPDDALPDAPVLNPNRRDCPYPFKDLAGVGVAFKLVLALARARTIPEERAFNFLDLVCLGTIADVVPLLGENRLFVQHGLPRLTASRKVGIRALMETADVGREGELTVRDVAFRLAPRINAAGRMEDARAAVQLLLTREEDEARALAEELSQHNDARRQEEMLTLTQAQALVAGGIDLAREKVIVLESESWHPGVIGIVASRLVERYHRPALLIAISDNQGKGSGRSIGAFNLWEGLRECADLLTRFGGHRYAAGFGIRPDRIPELRTRMNAVADELLSLADLRPQFEIDAEVAVSDLSPQFVQDLERLAPYGMGNPTPLLVTRGLTVEEAKRVGDGSHLSLRFTGARGQRVRGIWFRCGEAPAQLAPGDTVAACFRPRLEEWNGNVRVQLQLEDLALEASQ